MQKIFKKNYPSLFFLFFFLIQLLIYNDYGFDYDAYLQRNHGIISYNYILELFGLDTDYSSYKLDTFIFPDLPKLENYVDNEYGVVFELSWIFIEKFFSITDYPSIFYGRHYLNSLVFFIGSIYFYLTLKKIFPKDIAFLGLLMLVISPKIFANSFYNSKDIILLSFFCISNYYFLTFFLKKKFSSLCLFCLFAGMTVGIRVMGLMIPLLFLFFFLMENLEKNKYKNFKLLIPILFLISISVLIFWPYLWENPLRIIDAFKSLGDYEWRGMVYFLGDYHSSKYLPWYYVPINIFITIPFLYIILFLVGSFILIKYFIKNLLEINNLNINIWKNSSEIFYLYNLIVFFGSIILIIELNSTLYNDWRHLYFLYPSLVIIATYGLYKLNIFKYLRNKIKYILIVYIFYIASWIFINHPYQYVYFNETVSKKNIHKFELDYWGLSNLDLLKKLHELKKLNKYIVYRYSITPYYLSLFMMEKQMREKFLFTDDINKAEFVLSNHWYQQKNPLLEEIKLKKNYNLLYEIESNGVRINSIYEKRK